MINAEKSAAAKHRMNSKILVREGSQDSVYRGREEKIIGKITYQLTL